MHVSAGLSAAGKPPRHGSAEEGKLARRLRALRERVEKDAPNQVKLRRFRALYVNPLEDGLRWNRPSNVGRDEAEYWLDTAYVTYLRVRAEVLAATSSEELEQAFWGWEHQPRLPEPDWDIFDWNSAKPPAPARPLGSSQPT